MANQLPPGVGNKTTQGQINAVPCPHCSKPNDFRQLKGQQLMDTGHCCFCDHCGRSMEVVKIATVEIVVVRRDPTGKVAPARAAAQRRAQQQQLQKPPGLLSRLLGNGGKR